MPALFCKDAGDAFSFGLDLACQDPSGDRDSDRTLRTLRAWKAWEFGDLNVVGGQHFLTLDTLGSDANLQLMQLLVVANVKLWNPKSHLVASTTCVSRT